MKKINYKCLECICSQKSHGHRISNHLVNSAKFFTFTRPTLNFYQSTYRHFKTIYECSLERKFFLEKGYTLKNFFL